MNTWRKIFPIANGFGSSGKVSSFVWGLIITFIAGTILGILCVIPYIGWIFAALVGWIIGLYISANGGFTIAFFVLAKVAQAKAKPIETTAEEVAE